MFLLASPGMEEAVYVGFDGANVFVDMRYYKKTRLFAMPFYTRNDHFTKTGSGQT